MSQPGFFFYTGDWIKDTRVLDIFARGAWIDILCVMAERDGSVTWPLRAYEQYWALIDPNTVFPHAESIIAQFQRYNICEVVTERNGDITLRCRRMTRDIKSRESNRKRQERHRGKFSSNATVTEKNTVLPSPSPSLNLDSYKNKNPEPATPAPSADSPKPNGLDPEIKKYADQIYRTDMQKFSGLIRWIKQAQAGNWSDRSIALALERFVPYAQSVQQYWPYLDKLIEKAHGDLNRDLSLAEHKRHKTEDRETAKLFNLRGLVKDA
jgi:hypothetical protein